MACWSSGTQPIEVGVLRVLNNSEPVAWWWRLLWIAAVMAMALSIAYSCSVSQTFVAVASLVGVGHNMVGWMW